MLRKQVLVMCAAIAAITSSTANPPDPSPQSPITGIQGSGGAGQLNETRYLLRRGELYRTGQYDKNGNFIPYAGLNRINRPYLGGPISMVPVNGTTGSIEYEHRSGALILGTLVREPLGVFVPEMGSTILDVKKDFDAKKADMRIYNLPEGMFRPSKPAPKPVKAGQPKGWRLVPFRQLHPETPEKANPWFARVIGKVMELGHLSDEGEFVPDYGLPVFPYSPMKDQTLIRDVLQDGTQRPFYYTLPVVDAWYGNNNIKVGEDAEGVYEYRSGRLIKGTLHKTGNFVPELGSTILDFKDYDPSPPRTRRIYNLPGVLRPVEKK